ncbi:hypothetical protein CDA63_15815 [Hymenobacter amundsenii]|uniref:Fibronectin type-III domain-containing protein n=1 Tax=Hymenobacter amundsenii TaxID=2006685 RepID=A0A246FKJ8_9BACT|nr:T9SS type A sorting domain-containing protein [Hymenobacter amundsenii]OWP62115.1 hypothetical protein CDA63_15815 [Hymenobacter amundsenii]
MTQNYSKTRATTPWRKLALVGLLGLVTGGVAHAQALNYNVSNTFNGTTAYTDLGAAGTAITTPNTDDANSAATPIGFTFNFNGQDFTNFVLNTNGYLALGTTAPAAPYFPAGPQDGTGGPVAAAGQNNLLLPFNYDLESGTATAEYSYSTTGAAGSRVCVIQWKGVSDKALGGLAKQYASFDFQVKLYENSNVVEFVYNAPVVTTVGADAFHAAAVGIKGSGAAAGQVVLGTKGSTQAWSGTSFVNSNAGYGTTVNSHNFRRIAPPDAGRTYQFQPIQANDAAVATIYTMGKLAVPNSLPHTVSAVVSNNGFAALANVPVTLTVAGANTFTSTKTVETLAPGATQVVTFDAYPTTFVLGTNTLTVSVPADNNNSNNSLPYTQQITATDVAYINPAQGLAGAFSINPDAAGGAFAVKYKNSQPTSISQVKVGFPASAGSTSTYILQVLRADGANGTPGTVVYTSPVQNRLAAASTVTIALPLPIVQGDFYLAIRETSGGVALGYQIEDPIRNNTFYVQLSSGATWRSLTTFAGIPTRFAVDAVLAPVPACPAPTELAVSDIKTTSAVITFTGPANGTTYAVIYGPKGFNPATGGTTVTAPASPFTLTGLTNFTEYDVYVQANCGATDRSLLTGPVSFRALCEPPIVNAFPYAENFDGIAASANLAPCGIKLLNVNTDAKTWRVASSFNNNGVATPVASSAPNALIYEFNSAAPADDWFFTPALALKAGNKYQLSFKYRTFNAAYAEKLEVKFGSTDTPAGQTTTIWNNDNITNSTAYLTTGTGTSPAVMAITPTVSGNYYIGFHAYSDRDKYVLAVDDLNITSSVVTGTSSALQQAINLYPNPTAGKLTLEVRGANAKNGLQVEVTNMLGQRVHTATVRDNVTSQIDLSGLANGMYVVKVRNGNDYMVRNVSVQK